MLEGPPEPCGATDPRPTGLTGLSQLPQSVRDSLPPSEDPLAWEMVALTFGESHIGWSGPPKAIQGVNLKPLTALVDGPIDFDPGLFERWLGGIALTVCATPCSPSNKGDPEMACADMRQPR